MTWTPTPEDSIPPNDTLLAKLTKQSGDPDSGFITAGDINAIFQAMMSNIHYLEQTDDATAEIFTIKYDDDLGAWPARPTSDDGISYLWVGPTFPTVGGAGGFISSVDVYIPSAEVPGGGGGETAIEWTKATLASNWTHLVDTEAGYYAVQYARDGDQLHVRGVAASTTGSALVLTLPDVTPRVRPLYNQVKDGISGEGGARRVTVTPAGGVTLDVRVGYVYLNFSIWLDEDPFQ